MSIARRLMGGGAARHAPVEQRFISSSSAIPGPTDWLMDGGGVGMASGLGDRMAMRNMTVYGCVRLLADTIATLPWAVVREDANGFPVKVRPTPAVIASPMPGLTPWEWKWMQVWSLAIRGNAFNFVCGRDKWGKPSALLPVNPDMVQVDVPPGLTSQGLPIADWVEPVYRIGGEEVDRDDIVHFKRYPTTGTAMSLSPIAMAAATIGFALTAEEYGFKYFKDSAMPSGVLTSEATNLPDNVIEHAQKEWVRTHGGRRLPAVLSGGFKWQAVSVTPEESQFLETRGFQDRQIMRLYGIPPFMLGDSEKTTSWGSGIEQMGIGWLTYTVNPWLTCIEQKMSGNDITARGQQVDFDVDALQRGDAKARWEAHKTARYIGAKNGDEIRAAEGLPPIPAAPENPTPGQIYWQPTNMAPAGFVPAATDPAAPTDDDEGETDPDAGNNDQDANDEEAQGNDGEDA